MKNIYYFCHYYYNGIAIVIIFPVCSLYQIHHLRAS